MINKVILIGKIQESNLSFTNEGLTVLKFVLRTWEGSKTDFHKITYFDPGAEKAYKYNELFNDKNFNGYVYVEGKLSYRTFTGRDGVNRRVVDIIARNIRIIPTSPKNGTSGGEIKDEKPEKQKLLETSTEEIEHELEINEAELPF